MSLEFYVWPHLMGEMIDYEIEEDQDEEEGASKAGEDE